MRYARLPPWRVLVRAVTPCARLPLSEALDGHMRARPPAIVITIPLEQRPSIHLVCANSSEEARIREHIAAQPELCELVEAALRLERAA